MDPVGKDNSDDQGQWLPPFENHEGWGSLNGCGDGKRWPARPWEIPQPAQLAKIANVEFPSKVLIYLVAAVGLEPTTYGL